MNWIKFGGLVGVAFVLGLFFAGLLDLPKTSFAQSPKPAEAAKPIATSTRPTQPVVTANGGASAALVNLSDAFASVAEQVRPSVVYVRSRRTEKETERRIPQGLEDFFGNPRGRNNRGEPPVETGAGSGFIVSDDGYILTNNHVVDGADQVTVRLLDRHEFIAKVVGTDPNTDIAVIKIEPKRGVALTAARLGNSSATRIGEWVLAVGNPLSENLSFTVTSGIISAKGRGLPLPGQPNYRIQDFLQTDAAINRGNSGGPLLNVRGEVIGINSAIYSPTGVSAGYAFAIPIDLARQVMDQLITKGKVERSVIGVQVREATAVDAEYVGLDEVRGVKIGQFTGDNSPAKAAGLLQGDIIIAIDGEPVEYVAQLQQRIGFKKPGEIAKVEVARKGGVRRTFNVRVMAQTEAAQLASEDGSSEKGDSEAPAKSAEIKERLGFSVTALTEELVRESGLPSSVRGVAVESVDPYGPADGLFTGLPERLEVITAVEGKSVRTEMELRALVRGARRGEIVSLTVVTPTGPGQIATDVIRVKLR